MSQSHISASKQIKNFVTVEKNLKNSSQSNFSFLCTICWQHQPVGFKPKLLGQSARIVCERCWCAILDLSICWVCGEYIVRGDDVVSLGWCFWHRSCFGCLICGMRIALPRNENDSEVNAEDLIGNRHILNRIGIELNSVPLCEFCQIETGGEDEKQILERGLVTVSMFDGGVSRQRFELLGAKNGRVPIATSTAPQNSRPGNLARKSSGDYIGQLCGVSVDEFAPLLDNAANMSFTEESHETFTDEDILLESKLSTSDSDNEIMCSPIYLSIFDPLGETAFTPSMTKPLPSWMHLFPNEMPGIHERISQFDPTAVNLHSKEAEIYCQSKTEQSSSKILGLTSNKPNCLSDDTVKARRSCENSSAFNDIPKKLSLNRSLSLNSDDSKPLALTEMSRESQSLGTVYLTPPEYPLPDT
ncbi:hypothetical protein GcC1_193012 [Golovinomyces cichoracearum]|uniref:LIM zinc-binding domain-containing protein n=1 Tax=Golovinomyces cichoracearum TaxID=62708 RepID=A0A420HH61_9PEZI|nr:hypothetical protein GcC1_193012 [Golovinomyces cichoracearum]